MPKLAANLTMMFNEVDFLDRFGAAANGVMGIGGVNAFDPAFQDYAARHEEVTGSKPDSWASAMVYSTFQIYEQAIEGAGSIDKAGLFRIAATCWASTPLHIVCIPPSGSHTLIAPNVSPW